MRDTDYDNIQTSPIDSNSSIDFLNAPRDLLIRVMDPCLFYSEVPNRRAHRNKRAGLEKNSTLPAFLLSKLINEQGGIFCLLHEKLQAGWKENLKNLREHALLLGTSE